MTRIALATAVAMDTADADEELLMEHLPNAELAAWDDPSVDWSRFDVVVLRSTWNYTDHLDAFLDWIDLVSAVTRLVNPASVVRWNTDKRYLGQLANAGIPVVPTVYVEPGAAAPADALAGHVVVKPTVGAGSKGAALFKDDAVAAQSHLAQLHSEGRVAMVQPYLDGVDTAGETALIYLGGTFSHAARKAAILSKEMSWSTGLYADEKVVPTTASAAERSIADRIIAYVTEMTPGGADIAYARVDLLPTPDGPVLLELELTEPSLFLACDPGAPERAAVVFRALTGA